jgi:hypothetical protein
VVVFRDAENKPVYVGDFLYWQAADGATVRGQVVGVQTVSDVPHLLVAVTSRELVSLQQRTVSTWCLADVQPELVGAWGRLRAVEYAARTHGGLIAH